MLKIQQKYQGTVTPETYLSAVQNLRSAKFALSPESDPDHPAGAQDCRAERQGRLCAIGRAVDELKLDLVCIDPAIKAHSLDENSNPQMDAFATRLTHLAQEKNIAIDLLYHEKKGEALKRATQTAGAGQARSKTPRG
jgi:hypothetical protein